MSEVFQDFLFPTLSQIRHSICGIDDSYNNFWDILAELIQNAVDAINRTDPVVQGEIYLQIDCIRKEISIRDNGCGIAPEKLVTFLRPFSTDKLDDPIRCPSVIKFLLTTLKNGCAAEIEPTLKNAQNCGIR